MPDVPDTPSVPGETAAPEQVIAGLRAANMRLRELLAERDAQIAELPVRVGQVSQLEAAVAELQAQAAVVRQARPVARYLLRRRPGRVGRGA